MRRDYSIGKETDQSTCTLALDQFDKGYPVNERNARGIDCALRCTNVNIKRVNEYGPRSNTLAERCITLLRNYEKTLAPDTPPSNTKTPQHASSEAPPTLRPFLDDLRSRFAGRRAYGLLQLGRLGPKARPALPAVRSLLNDKATAFEYEEIDFNSNMLTVADLAADVVERIEDEGQDATKEKRGHH